MIISPPTYKEARAFLDGVALVKDQKEQYQFIDKQDNVLFQVTGKSPLTISDFKEGKSWQKIKGMRWIWQCIDKKGQPVLSLIHI